MGERDCGRGAKPGTRARCIIEIEQPDGRLVRAEASAEGLVPELDGIDLTTRKGLVDFISAADRGVVAIRNEAGGKALEAYAGEALKKTGRSPRDGG